MSTNHHRTSRRTAGVIVAILLSPLVTLSLAGPAAAHGASPDSTAVPSSHWHCRVLPILC